MLELKKIHAEKKGEIEQRLKDFKKVFREDDERLFAELAFCLLTPQSRAKLCWLAIQNINDAGMLHDSSEEQLLNHLSSVRFCGNKSRYIVEARKHMPIKDKIDPDNIAETREWLVSNVKGFGYKEASHFLRNIGFGSDIAILDRHILKNLKKHGVINEIPKTITKKNYFEIENRMRDFSKRSGIPMAHLDLLFWSNETGEIFK
ncbi:MAG TPA: N-glycosylase/DNA lyase [archaeon]|nr:N-glycosylase/DNA lyase [archaeon]